MIEFDETMRGEKAYYMPPFFGGYRDVIIDSIVNVNGRAIAVKAFDEDGYEVRAGVDCFRMSNNEERK